MMRTTKKGRKGALLLTFLLAGSLLFSGCKKEETVEYPAVIGCCDGISGWQCNLMVRIRRCRHSLTTGLHKRTEVIL